MMVLDMNSSILILVLQGLTILAAGFLVSFLCLSVDTEGKLKTGWQRYLWGVMVLGLLAYIDIYLFLYLANEPVTLPEPSKNLLGWFEEHAGILLIYMGISVCDYLAGLVNKKYTPPTSEKLERYQQVAAWILFGLCVIVFTALIALAQR